MPVPSHCLRPLLIALTAAGLAAQQTPEEALRALTEGNRRFCAERSVPQPLGEGVRRSLARGQSPFAVVLCCSDSRVPPEHVFNCGLGELFVIRVAGNTCDAATLASVEYAVEHLNTPLVVVLGHEACSAVAASARQVLALDGGDVPPAPTRAIQSLIEQIEPAVRKAQKNDYGGTELLHACEEENVHLTLHECLRRSELLRRYSRVGRVDLVPARYHLESGEVEWLPRRPLPPEPRHELDAGLAAVPPATPPHVALRMLQAGHRRFLGDGLPSGDVSAERRKALTHGQQPIAVVLTCADSRVGPEHIFDAGLGELHVIRVAGNVVTDDVLASIEYAAIQTGASLLVVMGHTCCGAITAAASHPESRQLTPSMRALLARLEPSVEKARRQAADPAALVDLAVRANVLRTATEVMSRSATLRDLERKGRFAVLPTVYDIASGDLTWLKSEVQNAAVAAPAPIAETAGQDMTAAHAPTADHGDPATAADREHPVPQPGAGRTGATAPAEPPAPTSTIEHELPGDPSDHPEPTAGTNAAEHGGHDAAAQMPHTDPEAHVAADPDHAPSDAAAPLHGHEKVPTRADIRANPWLQPIPIVGLAGVASLLLAALLAMPRRR